MIWKITQGGVVLTYSYDACGNITQVKTGTLITKYTYDKIGRLTRVNDQTDLTADATGTTWVFTYDLGGNIKTKKAYAYTTGSVSGLTPAESHTFTYGNAGWKDKLTKFDGTTITYDAIGNPLSDGTWSYTWEHGKQLRQMSKTGETVSFEYNEDGLRTKKTATSTGATEYTLHGKNIVHMTQGGRELHFYYDAQGKPSVVIYDGTAYGYLYNLQGDVVTLVDGTGTKVVEYTYDAWGKPTGKTGTMASTLGTVQPFRYCGYVYDEEIDFYYLRSRYYNANRGRFINADSVLDGTNLFQYCGNQPANKIDPAGKHPVPYDVDDEVSLDDFERVSSLVFLKNQATLYEDSDRKIIKQVCQGTYIGQPVYVLENTVTSYKVILEFYVDGKSSWKIGWISISDTSKTLWDIQLGRNQVFKYENAKFSNLRTFQYYLRAFDPSVFETGKYDKETIAAVIKLQQKYRITVDGLAGIDTFKCAVWEWLIFGNNYTIFNSKWLDPANAPYN